MSVVGKEVYEEGYDLKESDRRKIERYKNAIKHLNAIFVEIIKNHGSKREKLIENPETEEEELKNRIIEERNENRIDIPEAIKEYKSEIRFLKNRGYYREEDADAIKIKKRKSRKRKRKSVVLANLGKFSRRKKRTTKRR